jgi:tRNA (guanine-N7-)-methyltransferase
VIFEKVVQRMEMNSRASPAPRPSSAHRRNSGGCAQPQGATRLAQDGSVAQAMEQSAANAKLLELGVAGRIRWMTTKRDYRARAHSNPLNDGIGYDAPVSPAAFALTLPALFGRPAGDAASCAVNWCDVGCGFGGLLASLSVAFPSRNMIGLEIRERVADFCERRVLELRREYGDRAEGATGGSGAYRNVGFVRTNAMRFMPHYFAKGSLEKLFFCFPDPHFKKRRHRQRVVSDQLLAEYAYVLAPGGVAYFVTDVPELFEWMDERFARFPLFRRRTPAEVASDPVAPFVRDMTDEAARVEKSDRGKHDASFVRT